MKSNITALGKTATKTFEKITSMMNEGYLKLDNSPGSFMPLSVELVDDDYRTSIGNGKLISLAHYYEQNGDLMQDPEIVFFVLDKRTDQQKDIELLKVYPATYVMAGLGIYDEMLINKDGKTMVKAKNQRECASFCNMWFKNIIDQQNL